MVEFLPAFVTPAPAAAWGLQSSTPPGLSARMSFHPTADNSHPGKRGAWPLGRILHHFAGQGWQPVEERSVSPTPFTFSSWHGVWPKLLMMPSRAFLWVSSAMASKSTAPKKPREKKPKLTGTPYWNLPPGQSLQVSITEAQEVVFDQIRLLF